MFACESLETSSTLPLIRMRCSGDSVNDWLPLQQDWSSRICMLPERYGGSFANRIDALETRDDDVFVITFMKSGTTWMQELAWLLLNQLDFSSAKSSFLQERSVFLEASSIFDNLPMDTIDACKRMTSPRLIKSHLPAQLLPRQVWQQKRKIIYVARNPKDVVVSNFHFLTGLGLYADDFNTFVKEFINNKTFYTSYWTHIVDFWRMRNEPNIFFVTYEQMKRDLKNVIEQLSAFLDVNSLDAQQMEQLLNHLKFDNMKQSKYINGTASLKKLRKTSENFEFFRRGIVGSFKDELSEHQKQQLDKWTTEFLSEYNLKESDIFGQL